MAPTVVQAPALAVAGVAPVHGVRSACAWLLNKIHRFGRDVRVTRRAVGSGRGGRIRVAANRAVYNHLAARGDASWALFAPFTEEPPKKTSGIVVVLLLAAVRPRTALYTDWWPGRSWDWDSRSWRNVVQSLSTAVNSSPPGHPSQWASLVTDVIREVVRRSWTGHIVITGIAGFGIAYAMTAVHRPVTRRVVVASALVGLAVAGHLLWNSTASGVLRAGPVRHSGPLWLIRVGRRQESGCATAVAPQF